MGLSKRKLSALTKLAIFILASVTFLGLVSAGLAGISAPDTITMFAGILLTLVSGLGYYILCVMLNPVINAAILFEREKKG